MRVAFKKFMENVSYENIRHGFQKILHQDKLVLAYYNISEEDLV